MSLEFYFDLASPYAYLGLTRMLAGAREPGRVAWRPVDVEALKRAAGNVGPALRHLPAKLRYVRQDTQRWARRYRVPLAASAGQPAPRLNRGTFFAADRGMAEPYLQLAAARVWGAGTPPEDEALLRGLAEELGWPVQEFIDYTDSPAAVARLRASLLDARAAGVFGVPTAVLDGQLWWGNDRLALAEAALAEAEATGAALHG